MSDLVGNYGPVGSTGTGQGEGLARRVVRVPFGQFVISVALSEKNEFLGIVEVSVNEDFRSLRQRLHGVNVHDVDEFYKEPD